MILFYAQEHLCPGQTAADKGKSDNSTGGKFIPVLAQNRFSTRGTGVAEKMHIIPMPILGNACPLACGTEDAEIGLMTDEKEILLIHIRHQRPEAAQTIRRLADGKSLNRSPIL